MGEVCRSCRWGVRRKNRLVGVSGDSMYPWYLIRNGDLRRKFEILGLVVHNFAVGPEQ